LSYLKINVGLTKRGFLVLFIPYLTASAWYYLFSLKMMGYVLKGLGAASQIDWVNIWFNFSIVISILISNFFVDKVDKLRIIYAWAAIMPIATILLAFTSNLAIIVGLFLLLGALFGASLLAYCVYFCSLTNVEERGRVGGVMVFVPLLCFPLFLSLSSNFIDMLTSCVFLGVGTFIIQLLRPNEKAGLTTKEEFSTVQSHNDRSLLLYLIPWLVFCVINGMLARIIITYLSRQFSEVLFQAQVVGYLASSFGALVGGILADWAGRRVALSIGLISYGINAAISGLASTSRIFMFAAFGASGFSWGIFLVVYALVVLGDLASRKKCAPFYAAGFIPFYFFMGLGYLVTPEIHIPAMYVALVSSFLIFLSNVPIIFAKELLPPYITEKMYLSLHVQWIKKFLKKQKSSENKK
jgi:MFS family permease